MSATPPQAAQASSTEPEIVVDAEGYAICPECGERVQCGPSGIQNLLKRHLGSKTCKAAKAKKAKKSLKNGQISAFFGPKATPVPSTVSAPAPVRVLVKTTTAIELPLAPRCSGSSSIETSRSRFAPGSLLGQLEDAIKILPPTVQEATNSDTLAAFGQDPSQYVDAEVPAVEVYEHLNPLFHNTLGWAMPVEETAQLLRKGPLGLDGVLRFISYFVEKRGVREQDFAAKIQQILEGVYFLTQNSDSGLSASGGVNNSDVRFADTDSMIHNTDSSIADTYSEDALASPTPPVQDSPDDIEFIAHNRVPKFRPCEGYIYPLHDGQTFSTAYPVLLHDKWNLPWDFSVRRGVQLYTMFGVEQEQRLEGHHFEKRSRRPRERKLDVPVVAIGSGKVQRVDRVVRACVQQKRGIRGMMETYIRAQKGQYNPAKSEEEDMIGIAVWKLAGVRVAEIVHRALGLPGVTTLCNRMITPPLTASPGAPQVQEIDKNIDACFAGIIDTLVSKKVVHQIVLIDELSLEKRLRWDPRTNKFLGVCREHAHHVGLEFNGEGDLEELMDALEKKIDTQGKEYSNVHIAGEFYVLYRVASAVTCPSVHFGEATVAAVGIMSEDTRLYSARPILVSGDCKRESAGEHAKSVLTPVLHALDNKKDLTHLRTICLASDGETRRGAAFMIKTWKHPLSPSSNIYPLLKDLQFMNYMVGDDDLTADKDPKHVDKTWRNCILRERGIRVLGIDLTPGIIRTHLQSAGQTADHIRSAFNPEDKQNVKLAFDLLKDIWTLPPCLPTTNPGVAGARDALRTLGKLLYHFVSPYICVDFSLSEQLEHLSAAAHLALALFRKDGKRLCSTQTS
ncbi:hypothetical protein MSAN_02492200 [Mycena sanguinolenta]|uniref:Uncharacterized protein n=1 Tax=Mycena sanguinolenta TaxID=230812 RepID=A0A8H6WQB2_9AGAR|nr:hypothetical protein MSAN_02492200 [Mycena sanguinolenta]